LDTRYKKPDREVFNMENVFTVSSEPLPDEYVNDPIIQKLLSQQEKINRFKDACNPGISYGFYYSF
jgi:hypothetical protein